MEITQEIAQLKAEKDAIILAHYYVSPEIQAIADYVGDSFYLSKLAASLKNRVLVYCGVSFMGESGCLLNPEKEVLMPDAHADCPMAHMVKKNEIEQARAKYPDLAVVCYINSTAEIKSWSDVCVTSANALQIVRNLPNKNILFIPDKNLGRHVAENVPEKNVMTVSGYCPIHESIDPAEIAELKTLHPRAKLLVHPECRKEIVHMADYVGSTSGIIKFAGDSDAEEFIIATEVGVEYELKKQNPKKKFLFPRTLPVCRDMKLITLEKVLHVLKTGENRAGVGIGEGRLAKDTLTKMLELAK
ncbi:MAG: quinolinate synthase NadA [Clostridia bacterium]|nr:quinolinate synthase NadA [Clostridia bacterium]